MRLALFRGGSDHVLSTSLFLPLAQLPLYRRQRSVMQLGETVIFMAQSCLSVPCAIPTLPSIVFLTALIRMLGSVSSTHSLRHRLRPQFHPRRVLNLSGTCRRVIGLPPWPLYVSIIDHRLLSARRRCPSEVFSVYHQKLATPLESVLESRFPWYDHLHLSKNPKIRITIVIHQTTYYFWSILRPHHGVPPHHRRVVTVVPALLVQRHDSQNHLRLVDFLLRR
jgi:hypothetical protein